MLKKLSIIAICLAGLTACESNNQTRDPTLLLEPNMTKEQVISVLGLPYKKEAKGKFEAYIYYIPYSLSICFNENGRLSKTIRLSYALYCEGF
ncbi:MAG: hypothetical protein HXM15_08610 [Fusobacterium periodonticum]|jgi:lipoprotein|nr:hypothetical protein [Fusobacterium periodonticum]